MFTAICLLIFSITMLYAAYSDYKDYILSNKLCLTVFVLYFCFLGAGYIDGNPLPLNYVLISAGLSFILFLILLIFFALNMMGGGDVKLIPIVALWAGFNLINQYLLITAIVGGLLAGIIIIKNRLFTKKNVKYSKNDVKSSGNIKLTMSKMKQEKIPYGIAISFGGLFVAWKLRVLTGFSI